MKKIIGAAAAGLVLTGAAFADITFKGNARMGADVFKYTSPSRSTRPDNGTVTWATDRKHSDSVTLTGTSDNSGFNIKMSMNGPVGGKNGALEAEEYQLWTTLFGLRIDAGAYESRMGSNINNDGKWSDNLSGKYKTGIWTSFAGDSWGLDSTNITETNGSKKYTNFMVTKSGLLDGNLTLQGVLYTWSSGVTATGDAPANDNWIFTPFALGAKYSLDKNTKLAVVGKLNSITKGKYTEGKDTLTVGDWQYYEKVKSKETITDVEEILDKAGSYYEKHDGTFVDKTNEDSGIFRKWEYTEGSDSYTPDKSVYTLGVDYYKKTDSGTELSATYTFGMALYSNWSGIAAHNTDGSLVRDNDVFAHGFDFRTKTKLTNELSLTGIASVNYIQGTAVQKRKNRNTRTGTAYKDSLAKSYALSAAGTLGYWASVSLDYVMTDTINFQLQSLLSDGNAFDTVKVNNKTHVDYFKGMEWSLRPAVIFKPDAKTMVKSGVLLKMDGFQQNATGKDNTFKTTVSVPLTFNISL